MNMIDILIVLAGPTIAMIIALIFSGKLGKIGITKTMIVGLWTGFSGYALYSNPIVKPMNEIERTPIEEFAPATGEILDLNKKPTYDGTLSEKYDAANKAEQILEKP